LRTLMAGLSHLTLRPEGMAFSPTTGDTFILNKSGLLVLKAFQAGSSHEDVVRTLTEAYQVPHDHAERDVVDFQGRLGSFGLL
jgi:hypothetical protein